MRWRGFPWHRCATSDSGPPHLQTAVTLPNRSLPPRRTAPALAQDSLDSPTVRSTQRKLLRRLR